MVVILAAGQGTRMRSALPKALHPLCGWPMIRWPIEAARAAGAGRIVVVGSPEQALADALPDDVTLVVQREPRGTAHALAAAAELIDPAAPVVVLMGDVPLVGPEAIRSLLAAHAADGAVATMVTMELADPSGYGRVVRNAEGGVERVVETKAPGDATPAELRIREVNTGIFAFDGGPLLGALGQVQPDNAQGEHYLPDVLGVLARAGGRVGAHRVADATLTLGVNDRVDLAHVRALAQRAIHERHMRAGVTIVDPASTLIDADVAIGADTMIEPCTFLRGATRIGQRCAIGPASTLIDAELADDVSVTHSYLVGCRAHAGVTIGPFAYLRPDTILRESAKAGTFVEIKNSDVGPGAKVPHLSYIGDADIGERSNLGAGTITANYDGRAKHRTRIGARVRGGVDTAFVAPVTVGDDAYTAAGSVIVEDVPPGALGVARARQANIEGYARRRDADASGPARPAESASEGHTRQAESE